MTLSREGLVAEVGRLLERVREKAPLVHNITNFVVMNTTANALLALGASPVMAHAREEVEDMARVAGAVVLNIGTLTPDWVQAMILAGKVANAQGIPVVLDPVGAGATPLRTESSFELMEEVRVGILRGNAAEVGVLAGEKGEVKGVDAVALAGDVAEMAKAAATGLKTVVSATGKTDYLSDGTCVLAVANGHPLLARVTGTGCMVSALTGAFAAVSENMLHAALAALVTFGVAAEMAFEQAGERGPGSFHLALYDALYRIESQDIENRARVEVVE